MDSFTKGMEKINIRDIAGFRIGQQQDSVAATGCTVIISETGAVCGVDVRGGSPGTRDTDALNPINNRKTVHAVLLAGGSSFGLDAAGGVMRFLEERGIGRDVELTRVPNVCAAILFDLKCGDYRIRPDAAMGYAACENAFRGTPFQSGNFGAGTGATIGKARGTQFAMKGGIGAAAFRYGDLEAGAIVAVNCVGDVIDGGTIIAGALADGRLGFADSEAFILAEYRENNDFFSGGLANNNTAYENGSNTADINSDNSADRADKSNRTDRVGKNDGNTTDRADTAFKHDSDTASRFEKSDGNTVLGCIITNATFDKAGATRLAAQGQNGIARCIRPAHSIYDGDTVFALCTGKVAATADAAGILCAAVMEAAILDAIRCARSFGGYIAEMDLKKEK